MTDVERPALMGFGRDWCPLATAEEVSPTQQLLSKIDQLEQDKRELTLNVNEILAPLLSVYTLFCLRV